MNTWTELGIEMVERLPAEEITKIFNRLWLDEYLVTPEDWAWFEGAVQECGSFKRPANWIFNELAQAAKKTKKPLRFFYAFPLGGVLAQVEQGALDTKQARVKLKEFVDAAP